MDQRESIVSRRAAGCLSLLRAVYLWLERRAVEIAAAVGSNAVRVGTCGCEKV
jgi:hypothetical protein